MQTGMRIWHRSKALCLTLSVLVGAASPCPAVALDTTELARLSEDEIASQCSEKALATTGKYAEYNAMQCRWAQAPLRTLVPQNGNTCTCEALLNAAFELGMSGTIADLERTHKCDGGNFGIFADLASLQKQPLTGHVQGGFFGAIANRKLSNGDTAVKELIAAVSAGHIVVVGLNAKPIYKDFAKRHNISDPSPVWSSHSLLVRAVLKDQLGQPTYFVVVDSSGPHRRYVVPYSVLVDAYGSPLTMLARGVYVSDVTRLTYSRTVP